MVTRIPSNAVPVTSTFAEDGTTELVFGDGVVARIPSAIVRDAMGRGLDLPGLIASLGPTATNLLLVAILGELTGIRQMYEIRNELDASQLADSGVIPA
jgi:hypothetical protein